MEVIRIEGELNVEFHKEAVWEHCCTPFLQMKYIWC